LEAQRGRCTGNHAVSRRASAATVVGLGRRLRLPSLAPRQGEGCDGGCKRASRTRPAGRIARTPSAWRTRLPRAAGAIKRTAVAARRSRRAAGAATWASTGTAPAGPAGCTVPAASAGRRPTVASARARATASTTSAASVTPAASPSPVASATPAACAASGRPAVAAGSLRIRASLVEAEEADDRGGVNGCGVPAVLLRPRLENGEAARVLPALARVARHRSVG
jgi:hypothetical protein